MGLLSRAAKKAAPIRLYHGSDQPWILQGARPYLDAGEGIAFHAGPKVAAKDRLGVPSITTIDPIEYLPGPQGLRDALWKVFPGRIAVRAPTFGHGYVDKVRFGRGREIETPDLFDWHPRRWLWALDADEIKGLTEAERRSLMDAMAPLAQAKTFDGSELRKVLTDHGIQRIKYKNIAEGAGQYSYAALDPSIIATDSLYSRTARALGSGAAVGMLYPEDANAPEPSGLLSRVRRGSADPRGTGSLLLAGAP